MKDEVQGTAEATRLLRAIWDDIEFAAVESQTDDYRPKELQEETFARLAEFLFGQIPTTLSASFRGKWYAHTPTPIADSSAQKSAPQFPAAHNSGERDPSVISDHGGADANSKPADSSEAGTGIEAAAKFLAEKVTGFQWNSIRNDGRAGDAGFPPFGHYINARQEDYRDAVREIARLAAPVGAPVAKVYRSHLGYSIDKLPGFDPVDGQLLYTHPPAPAVGAEDVARRLKQAEQLLSEVEERFPDWKSFRDLTDCIDVTLHNLRRFGGA